MFKSPVKQALVFLFALALIKSIFFSFYGINIVDIGDRLTNGSRILSGELIYRDFFALFPPLNDYFYSIVFYFFGETVQAPRLIASLVFAFYPPLIFLLAKKFMPIRIALIPSVLMIFLNLSVERYYNFTFIYLAVFLVISAFETHRKFLYFLSGVIFGVASWIRYDFPAVYLIGILIGLLIHFFYKSRSSFVKRWVAVSTPLVVGYAVPIIALFLWLLSNGNFSPFFNYGVIKPVLVTKIQSVPFQIIWESLPRDLSLSEIARSYTVIYGNLILLLVLLSLIKLVQGFREAWLNRPFLGALLIAAVLSLPYFFGRADDGHMTRAELPILIVGTYVLYKLRLKLVSIMLVVVLLSASIIQSFWWVRFNDQPMVIRGSWIKLSSKYIPGSTTPSADTLTESIRFLQTNSTKDDPVLVLPYMAGIYFFADRRNPSKFNNIENGFISNSEEESLFIKSLSTVKVAVYDPIRGPLMKVNRLRDYNPLIHNYLMNNFEVMKITPEGWLFMRRKL